MTEPQKATVASLAASAGAFDTVREHVHTFAGIIGDLGGAAITILTLCWWIRLWVKHTTTGSGTPPASLPKPPTS